VTPFTQLSSSNIQRTPPVMGATPTVAALTKNGISLEPTISLDQRARFINHLHELRRINEATTRPTRRLCPQPGRIPVSILPGKCTDKGYGAEVTMTLTAHLNEELAAHHLPNLVLNDLVDQIRLPITQFINNTRKNSVYLASRCGRRPPQTV